MDLTSINTTNDLNCLKADIHALRLNPDTPLASLHPISAHLFQTLPKTNLTSALDELTLALDQLPQVHLTLAINPTPALLDSILTKLTQALGSRPVINLTLDPSIIGGAQVSFQGKFYSHTLADTLNQITNKP